tara:strand:- start:5216 stop:6310 length:1095 start_codon:yes stop_codon:yes gene_type:complete
MDLSTKQKHDLKKFVKELDSHKARHTEFITVYIPQGYDIVKVIQQLQDEQGTATNIKSSSTKKNVIDALEKMVSHLRLFKKTPDHGLACFSGNVSAREGQQDFKVWSIEPPVPIKTRIYRCDKNFVTDILGNMMETKEVFGLIVLDRRDGDIAYLKGKTIIPLLKTHSQVPGKFKAGGQSAARFMRQREDAAKDHLKKIASHVKDQFLGNKNLKGIIIGGPGPTKYDFAEGDFLTGDLKKKVIGIKDIGYTGEFGLKELLDKSEDVLAKEEIVNEKKLMSEFFDLLNKKPGKVAYGEKEVWEKLQQGIVDKVLISEVVDDETLEKFEKEAENFSTEFNIISTETTEGAQLKDIGKIAAVLRYEV